LQQICFKQICSHYQQLGGSDQWGNITAGIDLIRKLTGTADNKVSKAFGLTLPLITNSSGEKFGKSAGNAVWMDHGKTSFFNFYQFFVRIPDTEVPKLLKLYTFLPDDRIQEILRHHEVCGFVVLWFWPVSAPLFPSQIERARETGGPNSTGRGSYSPGAWRYDGHLLFDCFFFASLVCVAHSIAICSQRKASRKPNRQLKVVLSSSIFLLP